MEETLSSDDEFPNLDQIWRNPVTRPKESAAGGFPIDNRTKVKVSSHLVDRHIANPSPALRRRKLGSTNDTTLLGRWHGDEDTSARLETSPRRHIHKETSRRRTLRTPGRGSTVRNEPSEVHGEADGDCSSEELSLEDSEFIDDSDSDSGRDSTLLPQRFLVSTPETTKSRRKVDRGGAAARCQLLSFCHRLTVCAVSEPPRASNHFP